MLTLQDRLNSATNGPDWHLGITKDNKLISWRRCIYMEASELIDSFAWKHWKNINAEPNLDNIAIEIADIWHFLMSLGLENYAARIAPNGPLNALEKSQIIQQLGEDIIASVGFREFYKEAFNPSNYSIYELLGDIETIIHRTSSAAADFWEILRAFFELSLKCGVNLNRLYALYMGKNVLNQFRQDHGYKDGSYIKIWDGAEDNAVLSEILRSGVTGFEAIYSKLAKKYPSGDGIGKI